AFAAERLRDEQAGVQARAVGAGGGGGGACEEGGLDSGGGAGAAARRYVARFGAREVLCYDRSSQASAFAAERLRDEQAGVQARAVSSARDAAPDVVLISHVLSELDARGLQQLEDLLARTSRVLWVESGNRPVARALAAVRDRLCGPFTAVAPCPHQAGCPTLLDEDNWCHFFASPPAEVFTDGDWVKTARSLGIDLRSLPYAFVALDRSPGRVGARARRVLGRASINPVVATAQACGLSGLERVEVTKRADRGLWRALKKRPDAVDELLGDRG
ncbi:MAG: small ribosomal subunit Rsm22 family protein, partial [Planctomycetota bacterium]